MQMEPLSIGKAENIRLNKISLKGIEGEIEVKINNPNNIGFNVYPSYVDAYFSGIKLGRAETHDRVFLPANSNQTHKFFIKGDFKNISLADFTNLSLARMGQLELKGKIKAGKWFFRKSFDVTHTEKISLGK